MSHDTHSAHGHHTPQNDKPEFEFKAAFYFVLILVGLFVASLGFVQSMGHEEAGHDAHGANQTETKAHNTHGEASHETNQNVNPKHAEEQQEKQAAPAEHH